MVYVIIENRQGNKQLHLGNISLILLSCLEHKHKRIHRHPLRAHENENHQKTPFTHPHVAWNEHKRFHHRRLSCMFSSSPLLGMAF